MDLRVSITGGVHFDLVKRVMRDIQRSGQGPEEIIQQVGGAVRGEVERGWRGLRGRQSIDGVKACGRGHTKDAARRDAEGFHVARLGGGQVVGDTCATASGVAPAVKR